MFYYFGYGSNMSLASMRAKGVEPLSSRKANLPGWRLAFNVRHFFRHEGGVANVVPSTNSSDAVSGVVHQCDDAALEKLDAAEAYGYGYDRIEMPVVTSAGPVSAAVYVGMPGFLDDDCLPSQRYLNILCSGAEQAGIDTTYLQELRTHPVHQKRSYPPYITPSTPTDRFDAQALTARPELTALCSAVFDMSNARPQHEYLKKFFGGRDMTLFHLKRMDSSDGSETEEDIRFDRLSAAQRQYLNEYLHEYATEYVFAGTFDRQ
ncbi:MAG: gamma-glutamylcyclotransferase [Verrucomicrobiaceae bacterium]|nr:gamma-glutamylcyclotransferase [Verrucomicrobiaceae bacterium]